MSNIVEAGRNIVLLRKALNMKQEEVAFLSNLSVSRLQDIECGCPNVTFDTLTCISKTLGVDFRVLDIFLQSDAEILSAFHSQKPQLSGLDNGEFQIFSNIVWLRKVNRWTQKQLAQKSHISVARLRDIEHGCANTTIHKLACIADAFGLSLLELTALSLSEDELLSLVRNARAIVGVKFV